MVGGTDLRLSDKCLLTYGPADAVTLAERTGDTEISSSLLGENQKHSAMSKSLFTKSYSRKSPLPGLRRHLLHRRLTPSRRVWALECPILKATFFLFFHFSPLKSKCLPLLPCRLGRPSPQMQSCAENWWAFKWQWSWG